MSDSRQRKVFTTKNPETHKLCDAELVQANPTHRRIRRGTHVCRGSLSAHDADQPPHGRRQPRQDAPLREVQALCGRPAGSSADLLDAGAEVVAGVGDALPDGDLRRNIAATSKVDFGVCEASMAVEDGVVWSASVPEEGGGCMSLTEVHRGHLPRTVPA